ncbi:MAG: sensor histidine kinase [Gammaproteobacteria bacterium]
MHANVDDIKSRPWSLRVRLTLILIVALLLFQIAMMAVTMSMGLLPVINQSVEDLSARLIESATHWSELPAQARIEYEQTIKQDAGFYFFPDKGLEYSQISDLVFNKLLSKVLSKKLNRNIRIRSTLINETSFYWMDFKIKNQYIRIGFKHDRIGTNPYAIFFALLALNLIFSLLTAFIFVHYFTLPLMNLLNAAKSLGRGIKPEIQHANNSREIQDLYHQFEKMSTEVQTLIENRNTLLIGVSHELRTPMTRLTLLLEMARDRLGDANLKDCNQVIQEMNTIIGQFLSLGQGVTVQDSTQLDLYQSLQDIVDNFGTDRITYQSQAPYPILLPYDALRRVMLNLIDNALKYSGENKIEVRVEIKKLYFSILVLDRGIGVPKEKTSQILQAFVRVKNGGLPNVKGFGLGLAISQLIAQTNGWTILFTSRVGGGSIVKLDIPNPPN